jgi:hypothetical protein
MPEMIVIAGTIDFADESERDEAMKTASVLQKKTRRPERPEYDSTFTPRADFFTDT